MDDRYIKILGNITDEEFRKIQKSNVCVVGCGATGGYIIEMLARIGVLNITGVDDKIFNTSDLNSQCMSHSTNIFENKALETKKRIFTINPNVYFIPVFEKITSENAIDILAGNNVVIDASDSKEIQLILEEACKKIETPLVYASVYGWKGCISTILPNDRTISKIYSKLSKEDNIDNTSDLIFTYSLIASLQVNEAIKILLGRKDILHRKILTVDLLKMKFDIQDIVYEEVIEEKKEEYQDFPEKREAKANRNPFNFFKKN